MKYNSVLLLLAFLLTNCASIFTGLEDEIKFTSSPDNAAVYINGELVNTTPCNVTVRRKGEKIAMMKLEGYNDEVFELTKKFNVVTLLNLFGPPITGFGIDIITGAIKVQDPTFYNINLSQTNNNTSNNQESIKKKSIISQVVETRAETKLAEAEAKKTRAETARILADAEKARAEAALAEAEKAKKDASSEAVPEDQPQYRGGDPLKGLNVGNATENLVIGKYYALLIGIDNYQGEWAPLKNAVNDAKAIETLLHSKYRFDQFNTLYDSKATRTAIIKQLEWLVEIVQEDDNVFIYYSGHGEFKEKLNKGYWVPFDASSKSVAEYVSNNDIQAFLQGIKSKHTLLVSDACFSGDIFRGTTISVPFESSEKYYRKVHNLASRKAITSGGIEPVMDGGKEGHSVFAYYLIKSLSNNNETYFDASQLYNNLKIPVVNNSDQTPKFNPIKNTGDEGGQFVFIRK
ncbi:MAG TPA: caspase family protein [Flavobacteriales bacterium]|nr:caspase family protein [Flavobacteriales bacterium]